MKGGLWDCARFVDAVQIPYIAPSLGGVESLIEMPAVQVGMLHFASSSSSPSAWHLTLSVALA